MDKLKDFRLEITAIDRQIVELLGRRYKISREVAEYKNQHDIPMMQSAQVSHVIETTAKLAEAENIAPEFIRELFKMIIDESCRIQDDIIGICGDNPQENE